MVKLTQHFLQKQLSGRSKNNENYTLVALQKRYVRVHILEVTVQFGTETLQKGLLEFTKYNQTPTRSQSDIESSII